MKEAKEYFYNSLDTDLISEEKNTYRIAKGGLIDQAIKIAYIEGIRLASGYNMMDIKKCVERNGDNLNINNFEEHMKKIRNHRI